VEVPILYLLFTLTAAFISIPAGKLADKIGRKNVLYLSYFFWATVLLLFVYVETIIGIILAFIFYGLHKGALDPIQKTLVAELAPKEYVASTIGAFQMVIGLVALPASVFAGLLWDKVNPQAPIYFSLVLTLISISMLPLVKEK
jgi:MFS family permease